MDEKIITIEMKRDKDCKHSVRFATQDQQAPISSVYVNRSLPGINAAQTIHVAVEVAG